MAKNLLNKAQKKWLNEFLSSRPNSNYQTYCIDKGARTVDIQWREKTNIIVLDEKTYIATTIKHSLRVTMRMSGKFVKNGEYSFEITPPQKYRVDYNLSGQFTLDIPQNYLVKFPDNPVTVKRKSTKPANKKAQRTVKQQSLTLDKFSLELQNINYQKTSAIESKETLLQVSEDINLPTVIIALLRDWSATDEEIFITSQAFINGGIQSVLSYLEIMIKVRLKQ